MVLSRFFIDRPIFATVLSLVIVIAGAIAYFRLPVAQYPEVVPPTVVVRASYPGATPEVIADTVATPIEQEINGVEDMLYMSSQNTGDGQMQLTITFKLGTDLDKAQVLVQNRVAVAEARLPEEVRRIGVTTTKSSPDLLLVVHVLSPDNRYDQAYIGNYILTRVRDSLARLEGVGDITIFGLREYSMRVWLDPERIAARNLTASDVVAALREQNIQVAAGAVGQPPGAARERLQLSVNTLGRLIEPSSLRRSCSSAVMMGGSPAWVTWLGSNWVLATTRRIATSTTSPPWPWGSCNDRAPTRWPPPGPLARPWPDLARDFPPGLEYRIVYNPTVFVASSTPSSRRSSRRASWCSSSSWSLQDWRASLIPLLAIPRLAGRHLRGHGGSAFGFSLNMLSLFGLALAIGIVVENAIVVVENVERHIAAGLSPATPPAGP